MTPLEQLDYKHQWMAINKNPVKIHSDRMWAAKRWCKETLLHHQYVLKTYSGIYEHTFLFESTEASEAFKKLYAYNKTI